ncbi:MAG: hypothetical protein Q8L37_07630 [Candidatus Gottesmanbacteria bacterium]|nr:hypothetical protein [Candidatus Gottesmanbacteria bacterium]
MMNYRFGTIFGILVLPVLLLLFAQPIAASSPQAYQDYLYQFDLYRQKQSAFSVAKGEYEKFHSLTSQTTALSTTTAMLAQRNNLLRAYLLLLNEKINENPGLNELQKAELHGTVNTEIKFFDGHTMRIASIGSLEDATIVSRELETHNKILQTVMRQTITGISFGTLASLSRQFDMGFSQAQALVNASKAIFTPQKQATIDRWLQQIQNVRKLYQQKVDDIGSMNTKLSERSVDGLDDGFRNLKKDIAQAKIYLQDGNRFIGELIEALRYQN